MGKLIQLTAADGHQLDAYVAEPQSEPIGTIIVFQEIFGVNASIRAVADSYAEDGFVAIAPALFDRFERRLELGYDDESMKKAYSLYPQLKPETSLLDAEAAFEEAKKIGKGIGVVGFCYGGLLSWLVAVRGEEDKMRPDCVVGYYAGGIGQVAKEEPSCPVMLHFGKDDSHIGQDQVGAVRSAHPDVVIYEYDGAGHAFANAWRPSYVEAAAKVARERTLEFFKTHIA